MHVKDYMYYNAWSRQDSSSNCAEETNQPTPPKYGNPDHGLCELCSVLTGVRKRLTIKGFIPRPFVQDP